MIVSVVIVVVPVNLVMHMCVLADELAMTRVSSVNPMMMRAPVSWRPNILIAAIPVSRAFRVVRTIPNLYIDADSPRTRTHDHRSRRDGGQQNRYFFPVCNHTNDSPQTRGPDVAAIGSIEPTEKQPFSYEASTYFFRMALSLISVPARALEIGQVFFVSSACS